jgi:hypothetical protein
VPELQERGVYRTAYTGTTLREHLGLPAASASTNGEQRAVGWMRPPAVLGGAPSAGELQIGHWQGVPDQDGVSGGGHRGGAFATVSPGAESAGQWCGFFGGRANRRARTAFRSFPVGVEISEPDSTAELHRVLIELVPPDVQLGSTATPATAGYLARPQQLA